MLAQIAIGGSEPRAAYRLATEKGRMGRPFSLVALGRLGQPGLGPALDGQAWFDYWHRHCLLLDPRVALPDPTRDTIGQVKRRRVWRT